MTKVFDPPTRWQRWMPVFEGFDWVVKRTAAAR